MSNLIDQIRSMLTSLEGEMNKNTVADYDNYDVTSYRISTDAGEKIADYFRVREFRCKDGSDVVFIGRMLLNVLDDVRKNLGVTSITSGYRTISYNAKIDGAASKSKHCMGIAADIKVSGKTPKEVYDYLNKKYPNTFGIGLYDTFVHIDTRPERSRWNG